MSVEYSRLDAVAGARDGLGARDRAHWSPEASTSTSESETPFPDGLVYSADGSTLLCYDAASRTFRARREVHKDGDVTFEYAVARSGERAYDWRLCEDGRAFAASERDAPTTTRSTTSGEVLASYKSIDPRSDDVVGACGISFVDGYSKLACGCDGWVDAFDCARPGRDPATRVVARGTRNSEDVGAQRGLISTLDCCPTETDVFACGSYGGSATAIDCGVYDLRVGGGRALSWRAGGGGVTHIKWSVDGNFVYVASRRSDHISCVDVRNTGGVVYALQRPGSGTNQRVRFDLEPCGGHLVSGDERGGVHAFDLRTGERAFSTEATTINGPTVNSFAFHPYASATASFRERGGGFRGVSYAVGERVFPIARIDDDSSESSNALDHDDIIARFGVYHWEYPRTEETYARVPVPVPVPG